MRGGAIFSKLVKMGSSEMSALPLIALPGTSPRERGEESCSKIQTTKKAGIARLPVPVA
ncbi:MULTISPECIES: hypothetical protein [unclassified Mesorhizobium]|nr:MULTISPECIES: hypothetical protein [unclassified Mesorhizobium]